MRSLIQATTLVLMALAGAWSTHLWHPRAPALYLVDEPLADDEVSLDRVMSEWKGEVIWIDARTEEQFAEGHVPGARLLNEQGFHDQLFELLDVLQAADRPVVIYCSGERCAASRKIRDQLRLQFPLENVWVLRGGWPAWRASGGEIEVKSRG